MILTMETFFIEKSCKIKNGEVYLNGIQIFENSEASFKDFLKSFYQNLEIDYPKFFKMDNLSKLGFIATEVLLKHKESGVSEERNIALVFSNRAASLDTDRKHQDAITSQSAYASPGVFVYTLPNIVLGEISIRHRLHSENSFFIFNRFNAPHTYLYSKCILDGRKAEKVLAGWLDVDGDNYEAFLYLVSRNGEKAHSIEEIKRIYDA